MKVKYILYTYVNSSPNEIKVIHPSIFGVSTHSFHVKYKMNILFDPFVCPSYFQWFYPELFSPTPLFQPFPTWIFSILFHFIIEWNDDKSTGFPPKPLPNVCTLHSLSNDTSTFLNPAGSTALSSQLYGEVETWLSIHITVVLCLPRISIR